VGDQDKGISTAPAAGFYNLVQHLIAGGVTALLLRRPAFGEGEATDRAKGSLVKPAGVGRPY
jgi:hypothetical protein